MSYPYANQFDTNYENYNAVCPICSFRNIYNRASDLRTFEVIEFMTVKCFDCNNFFNIAYDLINPVYEYLIFDCHELKVQKRYMYCILNLSQAIEVFLSYCIEVRLVLQPDKDRIILTAKGFDEISAQFQKAIKGCAFQDLKNILINLFLEDAFVSEISIRNFITKLEDRCSRDNPKKRERKDQEIRDHLALDLANLFIKLKNLQVIPIRNRIVHKDAYRPTLAEVESCQREVEEVVRGLVKNLEIKDESHFLIG
jgi:hypothetical protein